MSISFERTRLAPSPTGALHLGHARTFFIAWWMARQAGAKIFMRMEDLDVGRATAASVSGAYADLRWLGMQWDGYGVGETQNAKHEAQNEVVQSERLGLYREAIERLWAAGRVYPCTCTRAEIAASVAASVGAPHDGDANVRYPGSCGPLNVEHRTLSAERVAEVVRAETGKAVCWRLRVTPGALAFEDLIAGRQVFDVGREVGDFPLTRFDGTPAYQLACVVDDHAMGMDLVVRGDDLLASTPRQMLVYRALGWEPPRFAHVPLVIGADGKRLAKRHGESRIGQFREQGVSAEKVVGWAAWRSGQVEGLREMSAAEVVARFDVEKLPKERVVIGESDLAWLR